MKEVKGRDYLLLISFRDNTLTAKLISALSLINLVYRFNFLFSMFFKCLNIIYIVFFMS